VQYFNQTSETLFKFRLYTVKIQTLYFVRNVVRGKLRRLDANTQKQQIPIGRVETRKCRRNVAVKPGMPITLLGVFQLVTTTCGLCLEMSVLVEYVTLGNRDRMKT